MEHLQIQFENLRNWWHDLQFSSIQKRSLFAVALLVIAISGFFVVNGSSQEVIAAPPVPAMETHAPLVTVDVAGAVNKPGVYALPGNSRVIDAIKAAGNTITGADVSDINLARIIRDGEQVYVYPPVVRNGISQSRILTLKPRVNGPIILNRASAKELEALSGIGPVLASRIIAYRTAHGPFVALEELLKVSGIGAAKFAQFKAKIRL